MDMNPLKRPLTKILTKLSYIFLFLKQAFFFGLHKTLALGCILEILTLEVAGPWFGGSKPWSLGFGLSKTWKREKGVLGKKRIWIS